MTTNAVQLNFEQHPSRLLPYFKGLIHKKKAVRGEVSLPSIQTTWNSLLINQTHLRRFREICQMPDNREIPFAYPLTLIFPSHMHILGHSQFPLSPFSMLQSRVRIRQFRFLTLNHHYNLHCRISDRHYTKKGMNLEIKSQFSQGGETVWEAVNTYFFRSRSPQNFPSVSTPKPAYRELSEHYEERSFRIPAKNGFAFARLSGDFNGIHYSSRYARLLGFKRDFSHAQRSIAICRHALTSLDSCDQMQLDVALKGPVYYEEDLVMQTDKNRDDYRIDLFCGKHAKPALVFQLNTG